MAHGLPFVPGWIYFPHILVWSVFHPAVHRWMQGHRSHLPGVPHKTGIQEQDVTREEHEMCALLTADLKIPTFE